jgi:hypothetical protein
MLYSRHPSFKARVDTIGRDRAPVLVVDNFCGEADGLIDAAETAFARASRRRDGFPGVVTTADQAFARSAVADLMPLICEAFGVSGRVQSGGFDFQIMTSPPEALSAAQTRPHYDVADMDVVASVLFLCRPPYLGTAFYRHNATGYEVISPDRAAAYEQSLAGESGRVPIGGYMNGTTPDYTQIADYGASYNRMILFSAASLHSGSAVRDHGFSSDPRAGRLTANLFLKFAR